MYEIPTAFLHFDTPGPGQILTAGRIVLQGWLVPKPASHYTDLRVVSGPEVFAGVYGFPRPDLAAHFKSDRPYLLAGFEIAVVLAAGRHQLSLEGCAISGAWERLESLDLSVQPDLNAGATAGPPTILATEAGEALRILLRQTSGGRHALPAAAAALVRTTPCPRYLRYPHRPFHGHLDEPQSWARSVFGRVAIAGWIFHESVPIKRVFATTDLQAVQNLRFGRETPFLARSHPEFPATTHCGFDGFLDLPAQLPQPVTVRVYVELADGSWHLGSVARIATTDQEFGKQPHGRFSPVVFWRTWRALVGAIKACGLLVESGPVYWQAVGDAWREYAEQAPRARAANPPVRRSPGAGSGSQGIGRVHLFTHNLSREGAPLFLLELARHLREEAGVSLSVTSGQEGALRQEYESLDANVQVVDPAPLLNPANARGVRQGLAAAAAQVELGSARLVIANTISAYWGVHLARRAGRPVLYYIHESTPPRSFFRGHMPPGALALVEESFRLADRVSFLTPATQHYFNGLSDQSNYCLNPGWIDLAGIDKFRATHRPDTLRPQLGIAPGKKLVVNLGTVCDRKGQHLFARAVDLLCRVAPALAASTEFLMVGGRQTPYDRALADFLLELNRPNLRVIPETGDAYRYYGAADLFVCSSYEESFPRVVLEAMAFELPIVATSVHGIPELVRPEVEAVLVAAGDSWALASAMQRLLLSPDHGKTLATRARARVAAEFDSRVMLPRHQALVRSLAATGP